EDLNPLEEAEGYQRLMDEFRHTQDVLAHRLGKSRSHVANMLRLLKLPASVQKYLQEGVLSMGHARTLVGVDNAAALAEIIVKKSLSVRQAESLVKQITGGADDKKAAAKRKPKSYVPRDVDVMALEERLTGLLGLKVQIDGEGTEGVLSIAYKSLDQLDDLIERLTQLPVTKY
ncbi:MAG: ParB/RepB/Spo0J family partition protein, partial [Alphaproteobacteria bacterium]|nr:ParB/RepB/Spo0J family partition protein [Alphaproteobacteria bacterium]